MGSGLAEFGLEATQPSQEDWGWYMDGQHDGKAYFIGIGGNAESKSLGDKGGIVLDHRQASIAQEEAEGTKPDVREQGHHRHSQTYRGWRAGYKVSAHRLSGKAVM